MATLLEKAKAVKEKPRKGFGKHNSPELTELAVEWALRRIKSGQARAILGSNMYPIFASALRRACDEGVLIEATNGKRRNRQQ